jgi:cytoskeletal protein CcmA (bactofilin family)
MFSKSKINEPGPKQGGAEGDAQGAGGAASSGSTNPGDSMNKPSTQPGKPKQAPSVLGADLTIVGNLRTTGDINVEGTIQGDIRAHLLTVGESANIEGEIVADDIVVTGKVTGRVRGLKVRLTSTARVEGDIIHKTIAIESGAHFEGSVQRAEDPLAGGDSGSGRAAFSSGQPRPGAPGMARPMAAGSMAGKSSED